MSWLLDTCAVSDFLKGTGGVLARIKATRPNRLAVSSITRMELDFGLALQPSRARALGPVLEAFLGRITTVPFEVPDAAAAGTLRAALQKRGQPIGAYDVLIAGTALARGMVLVTSNTGEFKRVAGLRVEDWR